MRKKRKLYDGTTKALYETSDEDHLILEFKDEIVSPDKSKKAKVKGKGKINNQISAYLFRYLESYHLPTHFVRLLTDTTMLVRRLRMLPFAVLVHNAASGKLARSLKVKQGAMLEAPVFQYVEKEVEGKSKVLSEEEVLKKGWVGAEDLRLIHRYASKANVVLRDFFRRRGIVLATLRLELGYNKNGRLLAGDEISPDTCRFWDEATGERYDLDVFLEDLGDVGKAYEKLRKRIFREDGIFAGAKEVTVGAASAQE